MQGTVSLQPWAYHRACVHTVLAYLLLVLCFKFHEIITEMLQDITDTILQVLEKDGYIKNHYHVTRINANRIWQFVIRKINLLKLQLRKTKNTSLIKSTRASHTYLTKNNLY